MRQGMKGRLISDNSSDLPYLYWQNPKKRRSYHRIQVYFLSTKYNNLPNLPVQL